MIVHVNSHVIRSNGAQGKKNPPLALRRTRSARAEYAHEAIIRDESGRVVARVCYEPEHPLSCGAKVWIETDLIVEPVVWEES